MAWSWVLRGSISKLTILGELGRRRMAFHELTLETILYWQKQSKISQIQ